MRAFLLGLLLTLAAPARAESWCAQPLYVHEWGVHVFGADGKPLPVAWTPPWFHSSSTPAGPLAPVRDLPADSGVRALPVMHFYAGAGFGGPIPIGLEVGFTGGPATRWYPGVDRFVPGGPKQLVWDRLELSRQPRIQPHTNDTRWIASARALDALWVERPGESERFAFYEAQTVEPSPLVIARAPDWKLGLPRYVVENRGRFPVHDVVLLDVKAGPGVTTGGAWSVRIERIEPGARATVTYDDRRIDYRAFVDALRLALTDGARPQPPAAGEWSMGANGECVMMRKPAEAFEHASGHGLYQAEVELVLETWGGRFFAPGKRIIYREDTAALDAAMPIALYTDMYHFIDLHRLGLAVQEGVTFP